MNLKALGILAALSITSNNVYSIEEDVILAIDIGHCKNYIKETGCRDKRKTGTWNSKYNIYEVDLVEKIASKAISIIRKSKPNAKIFINEKFPENSIMISLHIDFNDLNYDKYNGCKIGSNVGFPMKYSRLSDEILASKWKSNYANIYPRESTKDNYSNTLKNYMHYNKNHHTDLLISFGSLSCEKDIEFLKDTDKIGTLFGNFLLTEIYNIK